ncbi:chemotaxis protein CheD [uncultured Paludibaculum sp.]|uniref:chemotaxis protein CheD n=1 Tax=uncultured Paludibaculum sp. TaxID=1765020 RepID=UPI002AABF64A|nr:chemotaxis protein CheD [uncultured Paludibaculum sp.]
MGNTLVVGVGDCKVTGDPLAELVTYALGSCIAVAIWDPVTRVSGLLHFMLPDSGVDRNGNGREHPYRYADTGTPLLFRGAYQEGAEKRRLVVRLAGGAAVVNDNGVFNIGKRNYAALRKILWKAGVMVHAEDVGGGVSRTVRLEAESGRMIVRASGEPERELWPMNHAERTLSQGGPLCQNV